MMALVIESISKTGITGGVVMNANVDFLAGRRLLAVLAILLVVGLLSRPAAADVTAVFEAGGSLPITVEYRDDNHVRMRSPDGGYIVVTDGRGYLVSGSPGQWTVFAMDDFAAMMSQAGLEAGDLGMEEENYTLRDTGRTETIAGIQGQVHEVVMSDGWSEERVGEIVLSDHPDAREAYRGMMRIMAIMGEMAGQQGLDAMMSSTYGIGDRAILRADNEWRLASVDRSSLPDSYFRLPAEPTQMPDLGAAFSGQGGAATQEAAAALQGWLSDEATAAGRTAGDEARSIADEAADEARRGVSDGVRDGVRRGVRGLFGQ
jgi:hypothetical protein